MIRCCWCNFLVWPWQATAPRIFQGKICEMHIVCAAESIVEELRVINPKLLERGSQVARELQESAQEEAPGLSRVRPY